jgi:hypothetical protein
VWKKKCEKENTHTNQHRTKILEERFPTKNAKVVI